MNSNTRLQLFENMGVIKAKGYVDPVPVFAYQQSLFDDVDKVYISNKSCRNGHLGSLRL
jgi:2,3-bisphosphoglycerate-independent phosphoglycerate mutase